MSFGRAAERRSVVDDGAPCPCGTGDPFGACCGPLLKGEPAAAPERLMRSRYTAFFVGDAAHLARTWHPRTRPDTIELDDDVRWTGLTVLDVVAGGDGDATGVVEFRATWSGRGVAGVLHERSRFVRLRGRWWYLDGEAR